MPLIVSVIELSDIPNKWAWTWGLDRRKGAVTDVLRTYSTSLFNLAWFELFNMFCKILYKDSSTGFIVSPSLPKKYFVIFPTCLGLLGNIRKTTPSKNQNNYFKL